MANRHNFPTFTESAQDALFFQKLDEIAQKFGTSADSFTPNQVQALNKSSRLGSIYDVLAALNTAVGLSNAGATDGLGALKVARATYDVSGGDSGTIASHGLGVTIPDNAVVLRTWYDVVTTFTDGVADAGTIALTLQAAGDIVVAIAVADGSHPWTAGIHAGKIGFPNLGADAAHDTQLEVAALFAGVALKLTAAREITATVAGVAMTAGKMNVFVEYVVGD